MALKRRKPSAASNRTGSTSSPASENRTILQEIWSRARNPLNALLLTLAAVSYFLGDIRAAIVIALMVLLAIGTAFIQEHRSNEAAARLRAMVKTTASVRRAAGAGGNRLCRSSDRDPGSG